MRAQIAFLDFVTANFKFGGKPILPELLFSGIEFSFRPYPRRGGARRILLTRS
jgi:hypothetical protein